MSQLEIQGLCKSFGTVTAVDNVDISVNSGEMLCLLGPSGCGKTTLLRILSGFLEADAGSVRMGGKDVTHLPPEKRPTALVFQNYALFPHLNVFENVAFGLKVKKESSQKIEDISMKMLKVVGLEGMERRAITQLSGGQQQRVALARALVMEPEVLLLDEPLSNLDAKLRVETRRQIREIQQRIGITSVFVTHDQEEAMSMGDKVAILKEGSMQQVGTPMELYRNPANKFVAGFLGAPAMNFLPVTSQSESLSFKSVSLPKWECLKNGEYNLGVRPEDIWIDPSMKGDFQNGRITRVELLGDHALIYLQWEGQTICCRSSDFEQYKENQVVSFSVNAERIRFFTQNLTETPTP